MTTRNRILVAALVALTAISCRPATIPIAPFYSAQVAPGLWRGTQLRNQADATALGLKPPCVFWRLSNDGEGGVSFASESLWAHTAGCAFIRSAGIGYPLVNADALILIANQIEQARSRGASIFVHCKRGIDRTGVTIAAWELMYTDKTRDEVFHEMNLRRTDVDRALDLESTIELAKIAKEVGK